MSFFSSIGHFFVGIFNAAKKAYLQLSEEDKLALQSGTGITAVINGTIDGTVEDTRAAIKTAYPDIDEPKLEASLIELGNTFFGTKFSNGDEVIQKIKDSLKSAESKKAWSILSHGLAVGLSLILAPASTKLGTITMLIEWVYQHFIKKSTDQTPTA